MARVALYSEDQPPRVIEETLALDALNAREGDLSVRLGPVALTPRGARGELGRIRIEADFELTGREAVFAPAWLPKICQQVPCFHSHYGQLQSATCNGIRYSDLPVVYSTYHVGDLTRARWYLISAPRFDHSDLSLEICATRLFGRWEASFYIFFQECEYKFNSVFSSLFQIQTHAAGDVVDGTRIFAVSLSSRSISLAVRAQAPLDSFATLARDEHTTIHTTLFGSCAVRVTLPAQASPCLVEAEKTCLLELKNAS